MIDFCVAVNPAKTDSVVVLAYAVGLIGVSGPAMIVRMTGLLCCKRHALSSSGLNTDKFGALYTSPRLCLVPMYFTSGCLMKRASNLLCLFLKVCSPEIRKECLSKKV